MTDDRYRFHERKQILKGERHGRVFKLGDRIRVRVDRVNRLRHLQGLAPVAAIGAIAEGMKRLAWTRRPSAVHELQAAGEDEEEAGEHRAGAVDERG